MTAGHNFKMPFLMELEEALDRIELAINSRAPFYPFPKRFYWILKGLALLPFPLKKWIFNQILEKELGVEGRLV
jgi:hypothetical protein